MDNKSFAMRHLVGWADLSDADKNEIARCLKPFETAAQFSERRKLLWKSINLTSWCPYVDAADFNTLEIEYVPAGLVLEHHSADEYIRCWRNIRITSEEMLEVIVRHFVDAVKPHSYKVTMRESNVDERELVAISLASDNWVD